VPPRSPYLPIYTAFYSIKFETSSRSIHPGRTNNRSHMNNCTSNHSGIYRNTISTIIIFNRRNPQSSTTLKAVGHQTHCSY